MLSEYLVVRFQKIKLYLKVSVLLKWLLKRLLKVSFNSIRAIRKNTTHFLRELLYSNSFLCTAEYLESPLVMVYRFFLHTYLSLWHCRHSPLTLFFQFNYLQVESRLLLFDDKKIYQGHLRCIQYLLKCLLHVFSRRFDFSQRSISPLGTAMKRSVFMPGLYTLRLQQCWSR